jgi:hypothetical protein
MKAIYLALPTLHTIRKELFVMLLKSSHKVHFGVHSYVPSENARCHAIKSFMDTDLDWLCFIDHDTVPPHDFFDLVAIAEMRDIHIMSGVSYMKKDGLSRPQVLRFGEDDIFHSIHPLPVDTLMEVDAVGAGCLFIHRDVIEAFYDKGWPPFHRAYYEDGRVRRGEDIYFCERARELGFKTYVHTGYQCSHYKTVDLRAVYEREQELVQNVDDVVIPDDLAERIEEGTQLIPRDDADMETTGNARLWGLD